MQQAQGWKQRFVITTFVSTLCVALVAITAWGQEGPAQTASAKEGPALKPLAFEFRDTPWDKVLDWLADNSGGIPVMGITKPQGTFNFISPAGKKYTLPQIIDILNRSLLKDKIIIVRSSTSYTVLSNEDAQSIDTTVLPNITVDDLEIGKPYDQQKYGQSELCQITFNLNGLTVNEAEENLTSRKGPFGRFQKIPKGSMLLVTDTVSNLRQMKMLLDKIDPSTPDSGNLEVFVLRPAIDGADIETTIKSLFNLIQGGPAPAPNAPKIQYNDSQHKLLVNGDKAQIKLVRDTLTKMNALKVVQPTQAVEPGPGKGNAPQGPVPAEDAIRTVKLKVENASQYVDNLKYLLGSLRSNPVYVTFEPLMIQSIEDARKGVKPKDPVTGKEKELQLTDENRPAVKLDNKPGHPDKPVFIASLSRTNGVMLGSDDPEALDFAEQILAYLVKEGDTYYEIIPLKYSNAAIVRDTLDELINGKKDPAAGRNPMMMMMGGGGGGGGIRDQIAGQTVRLAADKRTNSILVRAPRQIVVTIKRFIENVLDVDNIDQQLQPKPRIISLKHALASDIADVLREIYREYLEPRNGGQQVQFTPFGPQQTTAPERSIKLSITANTRDNSVIVNCPNVLWKEVEELVAHLDKNNEEADKQAVILNLGKADPQVLQRALDTITGKQTGQGNDLSNMRNALNRFGGNNFGGGNFGGGNFGGNRGGGGGNVGGGGGRPGGGGGGRPGGGGGGPGGGRGGNRSDAPPAILSTISSLKPGGSDPFEGRVKEDPRTQVTFDQDDNKTNNNIVQAQAQTPAASQPPTRDANQPPEKLVLKAPRGDVTYSVTPDGQIVLIGDPADIKLVEEILKELIKTSPSAATVLKLYPLKYQDAGTLTLKLSEIFVRYNPVTKVLSGSTGTPGMGAPGGFGGNPGGVGGFGAQQRPGGFGQQGAGGLGQTAGAGNTAPVTPAVTPSQVSSVLLVAISRQNSILIGGPKTAMEEIQTIIELLDRPNSPASAPKIIPLRRANASIIATTLTQFYTQRFADGPTQNEIKILPDLRQNALVVFAGPEDLREIQTLVDFFDKSETKVVNEVRIRQLKNANASDLATTLQQALSQALFSANAPTSTGTGTGLGGGLPNLFGGGQQPGGFGGGGLNQGGLGGLGSAAQTQDHRGVSLNFGQAGKTGLLEDVGVYADVRTNRLIISAPAESIAMLEKLIDELDVPPTIVADVKVFRLKNADATAAITTLQTIFTGQQGTTAGRPGGALGGGGLLGGAQNQQGQMNFSTSSGMGPQPIIPRFSVDTRTNSVIIAAGRGDMILSEVILNNLDSAQVRDRMFQVVRIKNNQAANVAANLNSFYGNELTYLNQSDLTTYTISDREVTVIADNTNNSIIVGASQRYFSEVLRLIDQLDIELAQVAIQVLIAQVKLDNSDEFGVEVGLQTPVLFDRSLFQPQPGTTTAISPIGVPGYNFNNVSTTNPSNTTVAGSSIVGMRGITNYGTGYSNSTTGLGGFVFSAASNSVNVLVRALRTQGRIEVISRPQIITRDNQQALISVGQQVPIVNGTTVSGTGLITNNVIQQQVGIIVKVLPQISPDGRIVMRVEPQISKVSPSTVDLGNGAKGTIIDQTIASTTIEATDGKTVIIGGLISKEDDKTQNGIPWFGDLPYVGSLFRYRSQVKTKTELLIILTPHIIRNPQDAERVFIDESRKMSWSLDDVQAIHGNLPGASFLKQNCNDTGANPMINPFNENYFAPNTTQPRVDEKLGTPNGQMNNPGGMQMPAPGNQQPQTTPNWLQPPPGTQPPQGQQYQGYIAPQAYPVNSSVSGLPPQRTATGYNNVAPTNYNQPQQQLGSQQQLQQMQQQQQQQQMNGNWKTTVSYAPVQAGALPTVIQTQEMPVRQIQQPGTTSTGFAGGQQP